VYHEAPDAGRGFEVATSRGIPLLVDPKIRTIDY